jgi:O-antigen/teichoic acid export membrane protein
MAISLVKRGLSFMHRSDGSLQSKAIRSGLWVAVSSMGIAVLTFLRSVILARLLTPEIFGVMALCLQATRLIEIFTETGFGQALVHRQDRFEDARDTAFTLMVLRGVGLAALSWVIAPWVAAFYGQPILSQAVGAVGLTFLLMGFQNINSVALQKELDFRRLSYMEQLSALLSFIATIAMAWWMRNVWALIYAQVVTAAITSALSFVMIPGRTRFRFNWEVARTLFGYGRYITGLAIVLFLTRELDNGLIGKVLGPSMLGFYVAAYTLANIPSTNISKLVSRVMFPLFSKLQGDLPALRQEYARGIRLITSLVVPVSVAIIVLAHEIVSVLYGPRWEPVVLPLQILAVFGLFRALWMLNGYLYNAIGKPHVDFSTSLTRLVLMAAALYPLTVRFGLAGAATAVTVPMILQCVAGVFLSKRFIQAPFSLALQPLLAASVQGAVLAGVLLAAKFVVGSNPRIALVLLAAIATAVYLALNLRQVRTLLATSHAK